MSYKIRVDRHLEFRGGAGLQAGVLGHFMEKKRHDSDRFTGIAIDTTNRWAVSVPGTSDTIAISEVQGGSALITTGTVDNDSCMLASAIIYSGDKNAVVEFRITITDVSGTGLFVGLSDAKSESNNSVAIHYPGNSLTTVATDAAGFVIDADHESSSIMCASVDTGVDTTPVDTGVDWADGETKTLRIIVDTDGAATFVLDGDVVAKIASSVTPATLLCATVQAITRADEGANTVRVRSYDAWQDD
ncbi:MAG: hypothetical protein O2854_03890 [Chloroflexi bacterium]|nr:hypothetical protein [Chloroflexota bacterium]